MGRGSGVIERSGVLATSVQELKRFLPSTGAYPSRLIDELSNPDYNKHMPAAVKLGIDGSPSIIASLAELAARETNVSTKLHVILALLVAHTPEASRVLAQMLTDKSGEVRQVAAHRLAAFAAVAPEVFARLVAALDDPLPNVRGTAANTLGHLVEQASPADRDLVIDGLIKAAHDPVAEVRVKALSSLGKWRDPRAITVVVDATSDAWCEVRRAAFKALAEIGTDEVLPYITPLLDSEDPENREWAAVLLGITQNASAIPYLQRALDDANERVRAVAMYGLVLNKHSARKSLPLVVNALKNPNFPADVREKTVIALGSVPSWEAQFYIKQATGDALPRVRIAAYHAIGEGRHNQRVVEDLQAGLSDPVASVRVAVCEALGKTGVEQASRPLLDALDDESLLVRAAAINALGEVADSRSASHLKQKIADMQKTDITAYESLYPHFVKAISKIKDREVVSSKRQGSRSAQPLEPLC